MTSHWQMLAGYNAWANERVYRAAATLGEADWLADHGAFFGSLSGTLNHLVVTDRIWMRRLTGEGPSHSRLDDIVSHDRAELAAIRRAEDDRIKAFVDGLDDAGLARAVRYSPLTAPGSFSQPVAMILAHLANHQTHHRGQATVILTRIAGRDACESLDLAVYQRAAGIGVLAN